MWALPFWTIVCPDGCARHYPYSQRDAAIFDAKICDARGCGDWVHDPSEMEAVLPSCTERGHRVMPLIEA